MPLASSVFITIFFLSCRSRLIHFSNQIVTGKYFQQRKALARKLDITKELRQEMQDKIAGLSLILSNSKRME